MNEPVIPTLRIAYLPAEKPGEANVTISYPDGTKQSETVNVLDQPTLEQFADSVCQGHQGIDRAALMSELQSIATEIGLAARASLRAPKRRSQADLIVAMVFGMPGVELFHAPEGEAFASVPVKTHIETWRVNSKGFREWMRAMFYAENGKAPGSKAVEDAINTITGRAKYEGPERSVFVRVADDGGTIWLDLADADWRVVRITEQGWEVLDSNVARVRFIRRPGMQALPAPVHGGSVDELRPLLNLPSDAQWTLYVGWLVGALRPRGPYGVLAVDGEQGSAKSFLCKLGRRVIDPNLADLRRPPKDERDVFIAGGNGWICSYNNISGLKAEISDALCALATDGGFATRTLYANDDETIFSTRRPVMLNGIEELADRSDLSDRMIRLSLSPISEEKRRDEDELLREFERIRPRAARHS